MRFFCRVGLHRYWLVRNWWEGNTICASYRCVDCSRVHVGKTRT